MRINPSNVIQAYVDGNLSQITIKGMQHRGAQQDHYKLNFKTFLQKFSDLFYLKKIMGFFNTNEKDTEDQSECDLSFSSDRSFTKNDILICASYGNIYAIHKTDGSGLWKSAFKAGGGVISLFVTDEDKIIAGAFGKTACFDLMDGSMIWTNNMPVSIL